METEVIVIPNQKRARRAASICAFATVFAAVLMNGLMILYMRATQNLALTEQTSANLRLIVNMVISDFIAMPLAWLIFLRRLPKNQTLTADAPDKTPLSFRRLAFFFPCVFALMYAGSMTGKLIGLLFGEGLTDVVGSLLMPVSPWVTILCTAIVGPIAEELFFRKAMIDRLSVFHPTGAILFSALLFGMMHGNLTQFLYAFPIGVLFGIIYWRTKNIRYSILLHMAMNTLGGVIAQLILQLSEAGQAGGTIGTVSSAVMLLYGQLVIGLMVLGIIFLIRFRKRFLPIQTELPRCGRAFYLNVGWFVACVVFAGLFVYSEFVK